MDVKTPPSDTGPPVVKPGADPPVLDSKDLFTHGREVIVRHGAERYRLCLTSSNKLILIK